MRRGRTTVSIEMKEAAADRGRSQSRPKQSRNPREVKPAMTGECSRLSRSRFALGKRISLTAAQSG